MTFEEIAATNITIKFDANGGTGTIADISQASGAAARAAMNVTTKAVQLHGGYGYIREYEIERMMRDAKITEIYEGTSEVQEMVISANLLK